MPVDSEPLPRLQLGKFFFCHDKPILERSFFAALEGDKSQEQFLINTASCCTNDQEGQSSASFATYLYQLLYWLRRHPGHTLKQIDTILEEAIAGGVPAPVVHKYIPQYSEDREFLPDPEQGYWGSLGF
jgi:hypothetical protein